MLEDGKDIDADIASLIQTNSHPLRIAKLLWQVDVVPEAPDELPGDMFSPLLCHHGVLGLYEHHTVCDVVAPEVPTMYFARLRSTPRDRPVSDL